jgi:quinoprotein glucose dehydrogenase
LLQSSAATLTFASLPFALKAQGKAVGTAPANTEWHGYANDLASTRYAPLDQINADNFNKLQVAWSFSSNALGPRPDVNWQSTPIIANGRLFTTAGSRRDVVALNPATGELLWMYAKDEGARMGTRGGPGFGCSYWTDGTAERVVFVTIGYQMISLDAKTGLPDPAFGKNGIVDLRDDDDQEMDHIKAVIGIHASPLVVRDTIVVGDAPTAAVKGYLRAFDIRTGKRKWIFHTVPRKGEFGADTWVDQSQLDTVGNTGVWAQMSADPELGLVYAGVELPSGDQVGVARKGSALFGETIVALDIETGLRKWHYQLEHHGLWDRDVPCAAILCDIPHEGKIIKALAQPTKQAFLYVLDRVTGKPVWPIVETKVPTGDVPGEWYSPTQPRPSKPPAFDRQGFTEDDLADWTPAIKARAIEIAKHYRLGALWTPPAWAKPEGPWGTMILPGTQGGANWAGGSYDPDSHMVYVYSKTAVEAPGIGYQADGKTVAQTALAQTKNIADSGGGGFSGGRVRLGTSDAIDAPIVAGLFSIEGLPIHKPPYGRITAIDLTKGTLAWQTVHGETPDAIKNHPLLKGINIPRTGQASILGTLTTKTLVICGDGGLFTDETGRKGARLRAYDKITGEERGAVFMPKPQTGAAMTYMFEGRQYIVSACSTSTGGDLIAYRLPASA